MSLILVTKVLEQIKRHFYSDILKIQIGFVPRASSVLKVQLMICKLICILYKRVSSNASRPQKRQRIFQSTTTKLFL